jgi:hypothetical protein
MGIMKCDELKSLKNIECAFNTTSQQEQVIAEDSEGNCYGFDSWEEVYLKDEVDAAIAELKDKCQMHDFFWEGCGFAKRGFKNTIAVSEAFDRLEAENAELKQKLEDAQATAYAESVDAGMENRRLKRALWLARAERAIAEAEYWYGHTSGMYYIDATDVPDEEDDPYKRVKDTTIGWNKTWMNVERKCRAKAEEYK